MSETDKTSSPPYKRLHLGASRLEHLAAQGDVFFERSWIHLGDPAPDPSATGVFRRACAFAKQYGVRSAFFAVLDTLRNRSTAKLQGNPYEATEFRPWRWQKGDRLPFADREFQFVYSEHFFEHLFLDEAASLLRECRRVLAVGGVIRTLVPDADLRTDLPPEPLGFPSRRLPWTHPQKHKTRWSIYALDEVLRGTGFEPVWLRYADREGRLWSNHPREKAKAYETCLDRMMIERLDYVRRPNSLIADGIRLAD